MPVANTCEHCGASNLPNERFCGQCGATLAQSAERRTQSAGRGRGPGVEEAYQLPAWLEGPDDDENEPASRGEVTESAISPTPEPAPFPLPAWLAEPDEPDLADEEAQSTRPQAVATELWERGSEVEQAPNPRPPTSGPRAEPADLPAWLRDDRLDSVDVEPDATLSWLQEAHAEVQTGEDRDQGSEAGARGALWAPRREPGEENLPSWLRSWPDEQAEPIAQEPAGGEEVSGALAGDHLPAWLRDDGDDEYMAPPAAPIDWLVDTGPDRTVDLAAEESSAPPARARIARIYEDGATEAPARDHVARTYEAGLPEAGAHRSSTSMAAGEAPPWLKSLEPAVPFAASPLPHWLDDPDGRSTALFDEDVETVEPRPAPPPASELPPWLADVEPSEAAPAPASPHWLREPSALGVPGGRPESVSFGDLDLPIWLRDYESEAAAAEAAEAAVAPALPEIERSPERIAAIRLLERILVEPAPEPAAVPAPARRARIASIVPFMAFAILLGAILTVLLNPRVPLRLGARVVPPAVAQLERQIAALPPGAPVLIAYEWDVRRAAEMEPLEANMVAPLVARRTPLILMTTDPQGALLARRRAGLLLERRDNFYDQLGLGFVDLGYKPGGPLALARMATAFPSIFEQDWAGRGLDAEQQVLQTMCQSPGGNRAECRLDRIGMILVLADEREDVQNWVEQVASAQPDLPIAFGVPAEVGPLAVPYLTRPTMTLLAGLDGALALQETREGAGGLTDDWLGRRADATAIGRAAFGLLVVLGLLPAWWLGHRARQTGDASPWEH